MRCLIVSLSENKKKLKKLKKFRNNFLNNFCLCPSHYLRAPGLNWDATLDLIKVGLYLILEVHMNLFLVKSVRGYISYISKTYSRANNKY